MAQISVHQPEVALSEPTLVEGLPGVGLVGKIAADHLIETFDMMHYATCHCEGLPEVAIYHENETALTGPVRLYADPGHDLLVLQSDVPVSPTAAEAFAGCLTGWIGEVDALPIYLSGRPTDPDDERATYGVATGAAKTMLSDHDIDPPDERGAISGPTGALLYEAHRQDIDALGLIVEASAGFPDPAAATALIETAIAPITDLAVETESLLERAEEIRATRQQLAQRMQQSQEASSKAEPVGMYQ
ncbi:PAC2 family protein [Halorhabdus sp. BNX81]|uniref:proteasome assembly chaperone family protein n=1 Tax=Halorhabdus sp. BNX81 TaxID=2980181 RepID=UPI0023DD1C1B|nr:PAC2 family protein [Halorhabdus sp. BNX81]WEL21288.1 Archaeal enzyme of ATP-grasp superfamily [Halorhabdus sp. BNX81]